MSESGQTRFSVVLATKDRAAMLEEALAAALDQSHPPDELIVVDDGSTDDTPTVVERWRDRGIVGIRTTGAGVSAARNAGLRAARYEWVTFLDDDDLPTHRWLEAFASHASSCVGLVSAPITIRWPDGSEELRSPGPQDFTAQPVLLLPGAFAVRRELVTDAGGYLEGLTYAENTELGMRLLPRLEPKWSVAVHNAPVHLMRRDFVRRSAVGRKESILRVISEHEAMFATKPEMLSRWLSVAAVDTFRSGDALGARQLFARAFWHRPSPRTLARLTLSAMPTVGRRIWRSEKPLAK